MAKPLYSVEIAKEILDRLASGETLTKICKTDGMPHQTTVTGWIRTDTDGFAAKYTEARLAGYAVMADDIVDISDGTGEEVARSRLRVDTRKWLLSKCLPKIYGNRLDVNLANPVEELTEEERQEKIKELFKKLGYEKDE